AAALEAAEAAARSAAERGEPAWRVADRQARAAALREVGAMDAAQRARLAEARALERRADEWFEQGRFEQAATDAADAAERLEAELGEGHRAVAAAANRAGRAFYEQGELGRALGYFERAVALREATLGGEHPAVAQSLDDWGAVYYSLSDYGRARELIERALAIRRRTVGEDHADFARSLDSLSAWYYVQSDYARAITLAERCRAIREGALGKTHPHYAESLNNLGLLHHVTGDFTKALAYHEAALAVREAERYPDHPEVAESLNNLALLCKAMGDSERALSLLERAVENYRRRLGEGHPDFAASLGNVAGLYQDLGDPARAVPLREQAVGVWKQAVGEVHPEYARSLNNLATAYQAVGETERALSLYELALASFRASVGEASPDYVTGLNSLGALYGKLGAGERSAELFLSGLTSRWRYLTRNFPVMSERQKRQFFRVNGRVTGHALASLVFSGAQGVSAAAGLEGVLLDKQLVFESSRQEAGALRLAERGAAAGWLALWAERQALRGRYATLAMEGFDPAADAGEADAGAGVAGAAEAASRLRALSTRLDAIERELRGLDPEYARQAELDTVGLEDVVAALRPGEAVVEYVRYFPFDFEAQRWERMRYGAYVARAGGEVTAVPLGPVSEIDPAVRAYRAAMVRAIERFKVIVPGRGQARRSEAELGALASGLRERVWSPLEAALGGAERVYVAADGRLGLMPFEALATPAAEGPRSARWRYLVEDVELVYLNTSRDLGRLALTADGAGGAGRTAVLVGNPGFDASPERLASVVSGLPWVGDGDDAAAERGEAESGNGEAERGDEDDAAGEAGADGPGTLGGGVAGGEVRRVLPRNWGQYAVLTELVEDAAEQLEGLGWSVTTLLDEAAVEEAVAGVRGPTILQFATHGYLLDKAADGSGWDNPLLRSMLLLAGINRWNAGGAVFYRVGETVRGGAGRDGLDGVEQAALDAGRFELADGVLTAYEVAGLDLRGTELVNLTACETGLGEVTSDGVVGLRQAFLMAGARSLTMSMWEVPATETTEQVGEFYRRWLGGEGLARYEAFHQTQRAALERARARYGAGHPFYWAGVVYVGDPGGLPAAGAEEAEGDP
ncbi:MAG: CHAT domain-containing tetratricopeptide repeat protein, partial [Planctomycetota bacterium]